MKLREVVEYDAEDDAKGWEYYLGENLVGMVHYRSANTATVQEGVRPAGFQARFGQGMEAPEECFATKEHAVAWLAEQVIAGNQP